MKFAAIRDETGTGTYHTADGRRGFDDAICSAMNMAAKEDQSVCVEFYRDGWDPGGDPEPCAQIVIHPDGTFRGYSLDWTEYNFTRTGGSRDSVRTEVDLDTLCQRFGLDGAFA
jgi:hypothetical protein